MFDAPVVDRSRPPEMIRTRDLRAAEWSDRRIRAAVAAEALTRLRAGAFCPLETAADCVAAGRLRGRLTCVSELKRRGVFVLDNSALHVHIDPSASRLPTTSLPHRVHRGRLCRTPDPRALSVEVFDAVLHAVRCQTPRGAVATLDSALHHGLIDDDDLDELFAALPRRYRTLRRLLDKRAESGSESLMRLIVRSLRCSIIPQAEIAGVGRVDLLLDGWLIIECDSRGFHSSWESQKKDRSRDQEAAIRGYVTYRPLAEDIFWHADVVRAAVSGLLALRRA